MVLLAACTRDAAEPDGNSARTADPAVEARMKAAAAPVAPAWTVDATPAAASPPALTVHTAHAAPARAIVDSDAPPHLRPLLPPAAALAEAAAALPVALRDAAPATDGADDADLARTAHWWAAGAVFRWHEIARELTARRHLNSSMSSRMLTALAVAQHDAALAARRASLAGGESIDEARSAAVGAGNVERRNSVSQEAAIAYASLAVLREIFPQESRFLEQNALAHVGSRVWSGANSGAEIGAGRDLGIAVGRAAVERLRGDGAARANAPRVERQPDKWYSEKQTLPGWSNVKPWVMKSADQFRAPPPPAIDSAEFAQALAEIRRYSSQRSAEQLAIATFWNLGVGGISVPGMWGQVALQHAARERWSELRTARMMMVLNVAMHDALLASWETKYHYLVPRPSMRAPDIDEPLGLPSHPSYTSGHSAFSGAAEGVLKAAFPAHAEDFHRMAEEASASRFFGGIHYRFDGDQGLIQGRKVAELALGTHPLG